MQDDDKKAVKAFASLSMNQSNALKRNPKVSDMYFTFCSKTGNNLQRGIKVSVASDTSGMVVIGPWSGRPIRA